MQVLERAGGSPTADSFEKLFTPADFGFGPLFWAARDAVIVCDIARNRVIFCNPATEDIYGYTPQELEGKPFDIFMPEQVKPLVRQGAEAYLEGIRSGTRELDSELKTPIEWPAIHKDGHEMTVEFSVNPLHIQNEAIVFVIARDITERKRLETERNTLLADARATLLKANELAALKSDFVAMIAHEAGSPIAAIGGMIELLGRDDVPEDARKKISCTIRKEIKVLQRLVADVQDASSMDRGEFSSKLEPTSLPELLSEATESARARLSDHSFRLEPVPDVTVLADPGRISQVLGNLLGNAAKHTPPGTPVTLRARACDGHVHIDVIDEGPGISEEDLEHIFAKFGRGRDAAGHRVPGMGLGLYLSRGIVQDHGSTLFATSGRGTGTTFSFDLAEAS